MKVAIVRYVEGAHNAARALRLCDGLTDLRPGSSVLVKPNCVTGGPPKKSPKGTVTNVSLMAELIETLKEAGAGSITVGEGSIVVKDMGASTGSAFAWAGISDLRSRYGIHLLDFNKGPYREFDFEGHKVKVAGAAFEADFFVDMPVLKTHSQTRVSLGVKNLKGCLSQTSRKLFHKRDLEQFVALLGHQIKVDLCLIDGIFGLSRGPFGEGAIQLGLVIASRDMIAADMVGAEVMGIDCREVTHLRKLAEIKGHPFDLARLDVVGERLEDVRRALQWSHSWSEELLCAYDIRGLTIQDPGLTFCSGCTLTVFAGLRNFLKANAGKDFGGAEICMGGTRAGRDSHPVVLLGACPIAANKDVVGAFRVKGCPVSIANVVSNLMKVLC